MKFHAQSDPVMETIVKIGQTDNRTMDHKLSREGNYVEKVEEPAKASKKEKKRK